MPLLHSAATELCLPAGAKLSVVPEVYYEVFPKQRMLCLPPHRPYDCAIALLPDTPLPSCWLYNLSRAEQNAMGKYISEMLTSGQVCPSSSPVGAVFSFKGGWLQPCIDCLGLNKITTRPRTSCLSGMLCSCTSTEHMS